MFNTIKKIWLKKKFSLPAVRNLHNNKFQSLYNMFTRIKARFVTLQFKIRKPASSGPTGNISLKQKLSGKFTQLVAVLRSKVQHAQHLIPFHLKIFHGWVKKHVLEFHDNPRQKLAPITQFISDVFAVYGERKTEYWGRVLFKGFNKKKDMMPLYVNLVHLTRRLLIFIPVLYMNKKGWWALDFSLPYISNCADILLVNGSLLALIVIFAANPVYSLLALIGVFFHIIVILLILGVEFLSLIFLIIYVGAIAVLFLFVIMMFNLKDLAKSQAPTSGIRGFGLFNLTLFFALPSIKFYFILTQQLQKFIFEKNFIFLDNIFKTYDVQEFIIYNYNDIYIFSTLLYTYYAYLFILSAVILLASMVCAIVLAMSTVKK